MNKIKLSAHHELIHHFLEESSSLYPDKVALIHEDRRATYAEINSQANHLARWLLKHNVTQNDRVILLLENSLEYVASYYGVMKSGAAAVPLSTDVKPESFSYIIHEIKPKIIITTARFERIIQAVDPYDLDIQALVIRSPKFKWTSLPFETVKWEDLSQTDTIPNPDVSFPETTLASIIYTSGSTGKPKGVMLSHRNIVVNTHSICQYLELTNVDIQMVVLPFFYVMGKSLLNTHFAAGGTIVINNKFAFTTTVLNQMVEESITGFSGVPSTYAYLLHRSPLVKYRDKLTSLRYCSQAGGHMPRSIKKDLRNALPPHTDIYIMYGATEASARLSYLEPDTFSDKIDSIGKAIPGVTLNIIDANGKEVSPGQIGEITARGTNIMQGYWKDQEGTDLVLKNKRYYTGDLAYKDDNGYIYVIGRNDDMLKVGGHLVNPLEIENILMDSELLMESVVLGISDHLLGNRLTALVIPKDSNCSEIDILNYCSTKLPKYKMPGDIIFTKNIPKNSSGKIDRQSCMEIIKKKII
jgi:long-chain acyl-CoA synthetase